MNALTKIQPKAHAKLRQPSSASRWLSCPGSVYAVQLYPNEPSEASLKGDTAHDLLETGLIFGIQPDTDDADMDMNVRGVLEHIAQTRAKYGPDCKVWAEQWFDIPETGEGGTGDVTFVTPKLLHIADYKNGYVPVEVRRNPQLMLYLLGAIAKYGERSRYIIEIYQPNYNHIDGPYRQYEVTEDDLIFFRQEVAHALAHEDYRAGKHCKRTYCPHRGSCATFLGWAKEHLKDAYFSSEVNAMTDEQLAEAVEHSDILQGIRDELRREMIRRIMNLDRRFEGFKMVRGKQDREFRDEAATDKVRERCLELGAKFEDLHDIKFTTVAGIERFYKALFKNQGRGAWKKVWDDEVAPNLREFSGSLTLERAYDGRPAYKRGSEFTPLINNPDIQLNGIGTLPSLPRIL